MSNEQGTHPRLDDAAFNRLLGLCYWGKIDEVLAAVDIDSSLATRAGRGGETLLHHACMGQHLELVSALLERGSDAKMLNENGKSARSFATNNQHILALLDKRI